MDRIPFLVVGDGPQEPTGLGRIARDLCAQIVASDLPLDLVQVGGAIPPLWRAWPHVPMGEAERGGDWGASYVDAVWHSLWGRNTPGILFLIWDPSRVAAYQDLRASVQRWTYTAVDAPNRLGSIGGPAGEALAQWDRVLAYGRWASQIIKTVRESSVPYLPHGLDLAPFQRPESSEEERWVRTQFGPHVGQESLVLGCVATNQPRKDLGLFFQAVAELQARQHRVYVWLHTDVMVKAWSVLQLVEDCGLAKRVTVTTGNLTDQQMALLYRRCDVTIAPGLGEGFGYPIVESLAAGVPVVHGDFGGGRELVPKCEWRVPVRELRLDGVYAQQRPVFRADDVANAVERILDWRAEVGAPVVQAYCQGAVAHLAWDALWPRWRSWIAEGLKG